MGIYRLPNSNLDDALETLPTTIETTKKDNSSLIVMRNINIYISNLDKKQPNWPKSWSPITFKE